MVSKAHGAIDAWLGGMQLGYTAADSHRDAVNAMCDRAVGTVPSQPVEALGRSVHRGEGHGDGKLFTTNAPDPIRGAQFRLKHTADLAQHGIARRLAQAVVDPF